MILFATLQFNVKSLLFLIAAVIFGIAVILGWAGEPYTVWHPRATALALCLAMVACFIWSGGG